VTGKLECPIEGDHQRAIVLGEAEFLLRPRAGKVLAAAYLLGAADEDLRARSVLSWFHSTWNARVNSYGRLSVPEAPYFADTVARFSENCRQSFLRLPDGKVAGAFLGSDVDTKPINWVRDSFNSALALSMFEPHLCTGIIEYLLEWNLPPAPTPRGLARFPHASRVTQSLGNALSPLVLGGYYYQFTGDAAWFRSRAQFFRTACSLLDDVVRSRRGEPWLFPSMFISDGDARGEYHTGSNIIAAKAFRSMARLAREVYIQPQRAAEWDQIAARVESDIRKHCAGDGPLGRQFFEGVEASGEFVPGHDGEESDTNLASFYGFCSADDPEMIRHARLAFTESNPYYAAGIDGIWWFNEKWNSATFPGWITAIAGAQDETQLARRLGRIRQLTDLDGSVWWWPYKYGTQQPAAVLRAGSARKSGWASGVYLCRFMHDILGIHLDIPARRIYFRPFVPWKEFSWKNCRIGAGLFDLTYQAKQSSRVALLTNRTDFPLEVSIQLAAGRNPVTRTVGPGRSLRAEMPA